MKKKKYNICEYNKFEKALLITNKNFFNNIFQYKYLKYNKYIYFNKDYLNNDEYYKIFEDFNQSFFDKNYNYQNNFNKLVILCTLVSKLINVLNENNIYLKNKNNIYLSNDNEVINIKNILKVIFKNCSRGIKNIYKSHISKSIEFKDFIYICNSYHQDTFVHHNKTKEFITKNYKLSTLNQFLNLKRFQNNNDCSFKDIIIEGLNKIYPIFNYCLTIEEKNKLLKLNKIINHDFFYLYYDLIHHKINYKIYDKNINNIFLTLLNQKHKKYIKDFFNFLLELIDWNYVFQDLKPCYYCGQSQQFINISEYEIFYKNNSIIIKNFAIVHYHNCLPENNWVINKNIEENNYIKYYEGLVIKLMKEIKYHNIKYYDYFITPILKNYNENKLIPKNIYILTMKYGRNNKIAYFISLLQLRKKFSLLLNNLFKIVIQFII